MAINLKPEVTRPLISTAPKAKVQVYDDADLDAVVDKTTYAQRDSIPVDEVRMNYWLGYEKNMRDRMYLDASVRDRQHKQGIVQEAMLNAAAAGSTINDQDREYILGVSRAPFEANPNTILEREYSKRFSEDAATAPDSEVYDESEAEAPEETQKGRGALEEYTTKQQIASKILQEVKSRTDAAPILDKTVAFLKGLIPFYSWAQAANKIEGTSGNVFLGQNIEEQMRGLYLQSPEDFEANLRKAVEGIASENLLEALNFASAAVQYSGSDALWNNAFTILDASDVATLGGASAALKWLRRAKSTVRASAIPGSTTKVARQVLTGNIAGASQTQALQRIQAATSTVKAGQAAAVATSTIQPTPVKQMRALMASGQGVLDPKAFTRNIGSLTNERAARLEEVLSRNSELLVSTMTDVSHLGRINDAAAAKGFALAETEFKTTYPNLEDTIVDVRSVRESEDYYGGVDHIEVLLGQKDATGFSNPKTAERFAEKMYRLAPGSYDITEEAGNYFIRMTKTIDETNLKVQELRIGTNNTAPVSLSNTILGYLRSNTYLVSKENADWRKVATYGSNAVMSRLAEVGSTIQKLGKNESLRLRTLLDAERVTVGSGGKEMRTVYDFETAYQKHFGGSLPSDNELAAWGTYRQIADYDYTVQNVSVFRDKARLGVEQKSVGYSRGTDAGDGKIRWNYVNSEFFEGKTVEALPKTQEPYTVGFINPENGRWSFGVSDRMFPDARKKLTEAMESGNFKVIQVADPRNRALRDMVDSKGEPVEFLVVKDVKTKPLDPIQVPYSADLPFHQNTGFFVKQARSHKTGFGRRVIDGDTVVQRSVSNAEGRELADAYEKGRQLVKEAMASANPNLTAVTKFVQDNLPFKNAKDFISRFRGTPFAADDAPFDLDTPFLLTNAGEGTGKVRPHPATFSEELVDLDNSSHNLSNRVGGQTGSNSVGTQQNPIIAVSAAPVLDPMSVISRSASRITRNRFYDDYVHRSVEDWITQFSDTLAVDPSVLRANPMRFFQEPVYKTGYQDASVIAAAKNSRRAVLQLLGQDTTESATWKWMRQKVVDAAYKTSGQKGAAILEPWMFERGTDPVQIARSAVFHAKLGLFNPLQFPLQGSAIVHAVAVDGNPVRAIQAQFAYWGMRMRGLSEVNPKAQGFLTKKVSAALGVSEADLDEMYDAWRKSGVGIVSGEYGPLDDYLNPKMFFGREEAVSKTLDAGTVFFKEGNNWHRGTAFATAYLRWRQVNPEARLTNKALKEIVDRTDLMYLNMARDSNAAWQKGFPSVASTFFAYHARMSEQLLGKRLTPVEKIRVMTAYSAMWGVPIGVGGSLVGAVWPVNETIQQAMLENGIDGDANVFTKVLTEGVADTLVEWATGEDYNISDRFGPGGLSWLKDILDGEMFEVAQGAPGTFVGDFLKSTDPFVHLLASTFDNQPGEFPLTASDFTDVIRNSSTVNNFVKAYQVFTLGQWLAKNDNVLLEGEKGDVMTAMMAAAGLTPDEISEAYLQSNSNKQFDAAKKAITQEVLVNFERALSAAKQGEREVSQSFFKRAHVLMQSADFNAMERSEVFKMAVRVNRSMVEDVGQDFVLRDPTVRLERYQRRQEK